jgi:glycosyltransferase involved in cell wall biosynthesis
MDALTISLGRNILERGSRERERMRSYAKHLGALHIIVLTRKVHGYHEVQHEEQLYVYPTNSSSRFLMLWDALRIAMKIARHDRPLPLVISAQDPLEIGWLSWLLSWMQNTRLHIQVHGDYFSSNGWVGHSPLKWIRRAGALFLLRRAPSIRVVSERIRASLLARGVESERITVLPIRPELEMFLSTSHIVRDTPPYTFLYVGRLAPEKDIPRMLRAFALVHREYPQTKFRIVGEGSEKRSIESLIALHTLQDSVTIKPWTENVPSEMAEADIFLLASRHEAYALTLVEALAVGIPVVTTDVGCVGEVVKHGVHGIVVQGDDTQAYATAMKEMIENVELRKSCSQEGKKTARVLAEQTGEMYARAWVTQLSLRPEQV